jgi:hypothetical protein
VPSRTGKPYKEGELEVILSLPPTKANIFWLSKLLERSEASIQIIYKIAFEHGSFGKDAGIQEKKIIEAKKRIGLEIGRKKPRSESA